MRSYLRKQKKIERERWSPQKRETLRSDGPQIPTSSYRRKLLHRFARVHHGLPEGDVLAMLGGKAVIRERLQMHRAIACARKSARSGHHHGSGQPQQWRDMA